MTIDPSKGFTITRDFGATPQELWHAWTDPDTAAAWWQPEGVTTPRESVEIDARVGGRFRYTMINDDTGEKYPTGGVYQELNPYDRMVFTWGGPDDEPENALSMVTVTFEPNGDTTTMTFDLRGADGHKGDGYFYDGWDSVLDQLDKIIVTKGS